jgi:hypothetical protein
VTIGDLLVLGDPPAQLLKPLAVIASHLHPALDEQVVPGKSKESCVLASLTVRDFLWRAGFKDAQVRTVYLMVDAHDADGQPLHSLGVGDHAKVPTIGGKPGDTAERWSGHMVVVLPRIGLLIDPTLYQTQREVWGGAVPGMVTVPLSRGGQLWHGMKTLAGMVWESKQRTVRAVWFGQENERWRHAPDAHRARRAPAVQRMHLCLRHAKSP